jgi:hypothetical protein
VDDPDNGHCRKDLFSEDMLIYQQIVVEIQSQLGYFIIYRNNEKSFNNAENVGL